MRKLAIISTHPIQYNAPVFRLLTERKRVQVKVFYTWENSRDGFFDPKFKQQIKWDIPLLDGYDFYFVKNTSTDQGTHHRKGIVNPTLNKDVEEWKPDAVLIFGWNFQSHFRAMRHFKGKSPVLFRGDSTLLDEKKGLKTSLRRLILSYVYRFVDFGLYVGTNNRNYFSKHGLKEKQLIFAPHAIDNERFYAQQEEFEKEAEKWKKELKIAEDELVFLYAGKFEAKKDPLILVEAAKQLINKKLKFIFVGDGELKEQMIAASKGFSNIVFLSFQNQQQMPVLYRLAGVFVLPSKGPNETWGLAVNEAMACKKAILVSNRVGCAVDLVRNRKNGYIFEAGHLDDLMIKILEFNKEVVKSMGENSQNIIKDYNFAKICIALESAIVNAK